MQVRTDDSEELVAAAVGLEAAHGVPAWEGPQTLPAVLMGLQAEERATERLKMGGDAQPHFATARDCART